MQSIKISIVLISFYLLITVLSVRGQGIQPLSTGDRVPELNFTMVGYSAPTARLSDFKGKAVLIDCWATWCAPCVADLSVMDSLEKAHSNELAVLRVTDESKSVIETFAKRFQTVRHLKLASAVEDKTVQVLFPHRTVPHLIWIDKNGIVQAITDDEALTAGHLQDFLYGKSLANIPIKKDWENSATAATQQSAPTEILSGKDAFTQRGLIQQDSNLIFFSALTPFAPDGTGGAGRSGQFLLSSNIGILSLFATAYGNGTFAKYWAGNNTEVHTTDSALFFPQAGTGRQEVSSEQYIQWRKFPGRCYNYIVKIPAGAPESLKYTRMQNDLSAAFPFLTATIEQRPSQEIYAIKRLSEDSNRFATKGGDFSMNATRINLSATNVPMGRVVSEMEHFFEASSIKDIVDETGFKGRVDLDIETDMTKPEQIDAALKPYGLTLVKERRTKDILVLTDHRTEAQIKAFYEQHPMQIQEPLSKN